jgi:hypothetical protein
VDVWTSIGISVMRPFFSVSAEGAFSGIWFIESLEGTLYI